MADHGIPGCNFSFVSSHTPESAKEHAGIVWWTNSVCLPLIAVFGIFCNLLNILILTTNRGARRMPSWDLLVSLAICDSLFLLLAVLETSPLGISAVAISPTLNKFYVHSCLYVRTLASTFYKSSILIVLAFNLERYIYVVCPLRTHRYCTERMSRISVIGSLLISFMCSVQWPLCYKVQQCLEENTGLLMHIIALKESTVLQVYYRFMDWFSLFGFNILPIATLLFLNTRIILTLKRVAAEDSKRKEGLVAHEEKNTSRATANAMLFAVVGILLVCIGPQAPARILFSYLGQYHPTAILYACISQQMVFLNASLNFFLYCVVSGRYRSLMQATIMRIFPSASFRLPASKFSSAHAATTSLYEGAIPLVCTSRLPTHQKSHHSSTSSYQTSTTSYQPSPTSYQPSPVPHHHTNYLALPTSM